MEKQIDELFYKAIKNKLLMRGFSEYNIVNNRGIINAVIDETILKVIKGQ